MSRSNPSRSYLSRSESDGLDPNEALSRRDPEYFADQMQERPNRKGEVRIRLHQSPVPAPASAPAGLIKELRELHNMTLEPIGEDAGEEPIGEDAGEEPGGDIVIISGILPDNNFNRQQALDVVKKYAPHAAFA